MQLIHRNVQRFRGGLVFKAHRRLYHSTLGLRVIKKKKTRYAAAERKGNNLKGFKDIFLKMAQSKARFRIWPWLSYLCRIWVDSCVTRSNSNQKRVLVEDDQDKMGKKRSQFRCWKHPCWINRPDFSRQSYRCKSFPSTLCGTVPPPLSPSLALALSI